MNQAIRGFISKCSKPLMPLALFTTDTYSIFAYPNKHRWLFQSRDLIILVRAALCGRPFSSSMWPSFYPIIVAALLPYQCVPYHHQGRRTEKGRPHRAAPTGSPFQIHLFDMTESYGCFFLFSLLLI